jgi:hypothetical protein
MHLIWYNCQFHLFVQIVIDIKFAESPGTRHVC